jgi:hypothetical protein
VSTLTNLSLNTAKYDGIISKTRVIKYQEKMIEDSIIAENNIDEMHV